MARHLPGFGVVIHVGRKSGRQYRTPVNVFTRPGGWRFALTTYAEADWVRNVLEAGGGRLESRGRLARFANPVLVEDASLRHFPFAVRWILRRIGVDQVLVVDEAEGPGWRFDASARATVAATVRRSAVQPSSASCREPSLAPIGLDLADGVWTAEEMIVFGPLLDGRNIAYVDRRRRSVRPEARPLV